jgi:hypothetical protein
MKNAKIFKVISNELGYKFSFNAKNEKDAESKFSNWLNYHSHFRIDYKLEETTEEKWMHNEYVS